jgi:hypothetical protein
MKLTNLCETRMNTSIDLLVLFMFMLYFNFVIVCGLLVWKQIRFCMGFFLTFVYSCICIHQVLVCMMWRSKLYDVAVENRKYRIWVLFGQTRSHMTLKIKVLIWDKHTNVAGTKRLIGPQPSEVSPCNQHARYQSMWRITWPWSKRSMSYAISYCKLTWFSLTTCQTFNV